jgi:DNA-binding MarR family transcriptional regulator
MYRQRDRAFGPMPEPQWRMLLDLCVNGPASVTSLCLASGAPPTTALRHLGELEADGFVARSDDPRDARRHYLDLTGKARAMLEPLRLAA